MSRLRSHRTEGQRRILTVLGVGGISFLAAAAVGLSTQIAQPMVHDEFSYLLAADTFAQGRLSNPTHRFAPSFETFHVLESPSYASKYPPAQGFFLMIGQVMAHAPVVGVWISSAAMSAAIAWMLMAVVPLRWAWVGGLLAAARFGIVGPWAQSYWGGAVAALAGALVLGAAFRLMEHRRLRDAIALALGVLLLANSRPFEGLLLCIPVAAWLLADFVHKPDPKALLRNVALPGLLVLGLGLGWMGYYNARVTGDPLTLPYALYEERTPVPAFTFQPLGPEPAYRDPRIKKQQVEFVRGFWDKPRAVSWMAPDLVQSRWIPAWRFYLGWIWTLPLVVLPLAWRRRSTGLLLACIGIELVGTSVTTYAMPHYLAPMTGAVVGLVTLCLVELAAMRRGPSIGLAIAVGLVVASWGVALTRVNEHVFPERMWNRQRAGLVEVLSKTPHRHLILVDYPADYPIVAEWVYNGANIDGSRVAWARSMGPQKDRALARHYPDRQIWRLFFAQRANLPQSETERSPARSFGGAVLESHPLGRDRGPFPYNEVTVPWKPRDSWNALGRKP